MRVRYVPLPLPHKYNLGDTNARMHQKGSLIFHGVKVSGNQICISTVNFTAHLWGVWNDSNMRNVCLLLLLYLILLLIITIIEQLLLLPLFNHSENCIMYANGFTWAAIIICLPIRFIRFSDRYFQSLFINSFLMWTVFNVDSS